MAADTLSIVLLIASTGHAPHEVESPAADTAESADSWLQWRGNARDGQFTGPTWPTRLQEHLQPVWRVPQLGPSYCGPLITDDVIITAETRDERFEVVQAYDRASGAKLWETTWEGAMQVPFFAAKNGSWIRSTPASDGERVYVGGMRDVLVCLDIASGEERWRVDFISQLDAPLPDFGFVCSPLLTEEHLYVQAGASLCKIDKLTGEILWRSLEDGGGMMGSAFSSPILSTINGREQLLVLSRERMHGVDPNSGEELWNLPIKSFRGMNILTPIEWENAIFTAPYGGRAQLLDIQANESGALAAEPRWDNRIQGYMTSPVIIDDHAYLFTRSNRFTCIRLEDGEVMWISPPPREEYWSLVAQDDRILALSNTGVLRLIKADPAAYEVIDEVRITDSPAWAHLAMAGRQIAVREQDALVLYDWIPDQP